MTQRAQSLLSRRSLLTGAGASLLSLSLPRPLRAATAPERAIHLLHQRTGEVFSGKYFDGGGYLREAMQSFAHFARDIHAGAERPMDPRLMDIIWLIQQRLGTGEPIVVTNGYRTAETNAKTRGAASNSYHIKGAALDIKHPNVAASKLHAAAAEVDAGGIGRYRTFVHVDTGPKRRW